MEIEEQKEQETRKIEPVKVPVPTKEPAPERVPEKAPAKPDREKVPA